MGGTYTKDISNDGIMTSAWKNYVGSNNAYKGFYVSKTDDNKYYFNNEAVVAGLKNIFPNGAVAFWDPITIIENRPGGYTFNKVSISNASISLKNKPDNEIEFGIRYINYNNANSYTSNNVSISDCTYSGVSYETLDKYFK